MLNPIADLWPAYPLAALALLGTGLVALAAIRQIRAHSPWSQTSRLLTWLRGFRLAIVGLALVGIALALLMGQTWLLVLSLGIAGEEIFETTWMISTLERDRRRFYRLRAD
jgi:hypothetical protein